MNSSYTLADKKEYFVVDCLKFIASYMVLGVHFMMFLDVNKDLNFWATQILFRLAVPFFFVSSGYFSANKLHDKAKMLGYLKRLFVTYMVYTVVYIPILWEQYEKKGYTLMMRVDDFLYGFFINGSFFHLWYFVAVFVATLILYVMINRLQLSDKKLLVVTSILYVIGTLGNAYRNIWVKVLPIVDKIFTAYESIFGTTRNGIFMAPLFMVLGYLMKKHSAKITYKRYWLYAILLFGVMNVEEYFAKAITDHVGQSMLFVTPAVMVMFFLAACFIRVPEKLVPIGIFLRNMGVVVYAFHMFFHEKYGNELSGYAPYGFIYFLMIAKRVTILAFILVSLSRMKIFSWLKYFY